ncbi:MAG: uridylate kinase [Euryarchaeota archaeon]|nr:uridylate kinase [Euryarchaeota archaeon]
MKDETLVRRAFLKGLEEGKQLRLLPELNVIKLGGHGAIDYGREVVLPLVEEIGNASSSYQILVVTGGGARVRHVLDIGADLGMPTGILAELASKVSEQNAIMMALLFSSYNGTRIKREDLLDLPMLFHLGVLPVIHGTPPYGLYEHPPQIGRIPPHRTDTGALLMAEVLGARSCILVKDVDGLYTENPRINPRAELIKDVSARELLAMDLEDLVLERMVVELLRRTVNVKEVRIVNGLVPGNVLKALMGQNVGTVIHGYDA